MRASDAPPPAPRPSVALSSSSVSVLPLQATMPTSSLTGTARAGEKRPARVKPSWSYELVLDEPKEVLTDAFGRGKRRKSVDNAGGVSVGSSGAIAPATVAAGADGPRRTGHACAEGPNSRLERDRLGQGTGGLKGMRMEAEYEARWKALEQEVNDAFSQVDRDELLNSLLSAEPSRPWSPSEDIFLLTAVETFCASSTLDVVLLNPSTSFLGERTWSTILDLFEDRVRLDAAYTPFAVEVVSRDSSALYARYYDLLHPFSTPSRATPGGVPNQDGWTEEDVSALLAKVRAAGGSGKLGWRDAVERTAKWVQVKVAVGGNRGMGEILKKWAERERQV
ncbi:hypothetical protein JCM10213_002287, partial [Rhodosporidiobolus nylandii]